MVSQSIIMATLGFFAVYPNLLFGMTPTVANPLLSQLCYGFTILPENIA